MSTNLLILCSVTRLIVTKLIILAQTYPSQAELDRSVHKQLGSLSVVMMNTFVILNLKTWDHPPLVQALCG